MMRFLVLAGLAGSLVGGCTEPSPPGGPFVSSSSARMMLPLPVPTNLDVLVVIDRSPAMAEHQAGVRAQLPELAAVLEALPLGRVGLHLGVITSDLGAEGVAVPGCAGDGEGGRLRTATGIDGAFLVELPGIDGSPVRNYQGSLADALGRLADAGTQGCPYSRPLEAARRALGAEPANAGFLRPDAYLAVVFITPQDDCSFADASFLGASTSVDTMRCISMASALTPVEEHVQFLTTLEMDPAKVVVAGILGPSATRLRALLAMFPNRSGEAAIGGDDHASALALLAQLQKTTLGYPCWGAAIADLDPETPGTQFDCAAWYRVGPAGGEEHTLPLCAADGATTATPCWRLVEDAPRMFCPSGFSPELETGGRSYAKGGLATFECLVADPQ